MDRSILKRLESLQSFADRQRPAVMTIHFSDGSEVVADPTGTWDIFRDHTRREDVVNIIADRPEYVAAAGIMTILCHPAEDRRIESYV